jgi:hypothetical protein
MYLSVGGMMALVLALWVMVLPVQIRKARGGGLKSAFTPSGQAAEDGASLVAEWRASVESTKRTIGNMTADLERQMKTEAAAEEAVDAGNADSESPPLDVDAIRERLEAAGNGAASPASEPINP